MSKGLSDDDRQEILRLYQGGLSYSDVRDITGKSFSAIASVVKGMRSISDATRMARHAGKGKYGSPEYKKNLSAGAIRSLSKRSKFWTVPEREFFALIADLGFGVRVPKIICAEIDQCKDDHGVFAFQYVIQRYVCDFVHLEGRIVFNINGDYWHANPILYGEDDEGLTKTQRFNKNRDILKRRYLEQNGWVVIDIWESDLKYRRDYVVQVVQRAIGEIESRLTYIQQSGERNPHCPQEEDWSEKLKNLWFSSKKKRESTRIEQACLQCKTVYTVVPSKKERSKYCSRECSDFARRKIKRPSVEELRKAMGDSPNWLQLGKRYGVSDNAVRKWARKYGLL